MTGKQCGRKFAFTEMPMLSDAQLESLRNAPLGNLPNRLALAFTMTGTRQSEACERLGLSPSHLSKMVRGTLQSVDVTLAQRLAAFFGCAIEDLFPAKSEAA